MKHSLLNKVEEIVNALACNELQTIEVRGALNMAMQLRAELEVIDENTLGKKEEVKEEAEVKKTKHFFEDEPIYDKKDKKDSDNNKQ